MNHIIGSSGFLSLALIRDLPNKFNRNSLLSLRKDKIDDLLKTIIKNQNIKEPTNIIFAAWPTRIGYDNIEHFDFLNNLAIPFLTKLSQEINNFRLITYGSCLEYGLKEGILDEKSLAIPCTKIGSAKLMLYDKCRNLLKEKNYIHLRIFYPYCHELPRIGSFLDYLDKDLNSGKNTFKMSVGTQRRDFFDTQLLSNLVDKLLNKSSWAYDLINVGSCKSKSVIDLAKEHLIFKNNTINFETGVSPIPWYEPYIFYAGHTEQIKSFLM